MSTPVRTKTTKIPPTIKPGRNITINQAIMALPKPVLCLVFITTHCKIHPTHGTMLHNIIKIHVPNRDFLNDPFTALIPIFKNNRFKRIIPIIRATRMMIATVPRPPNHTNKSFQYCIYL